ncbi:MAG: integron integrase, partial [Ramlibacter sp.]|nr:integron integrase [Ramlibacter sp.]
MDVLASQFLADLAVHQPPPSEWQQDQIRKALDVFARGVDHWRFERDEAGRLRPAFRLKPESAAAPEAPAGVRLSTASPIPSPEPRISPTPVPGATTPSSTPAPDPDPETTPGGDWQQRFVSAMRLRRYSLRTEEAYRDWIRRFLRFHGDVAPESLAEPEVREYLEYLAVARNVSASTQNQALSALLFLYASVLEHPLGELKEVVRARRPSRLPVVLSREEVQRLLQAMEGTLGLITRLLYGTGLRLMEGLRLRVKDVDFERGQITVREGKGDKDRIVMLPVALREPLQVHLQRVRLLWESDRAAGLPGVWMPQALDRKYPEAGREWAWMWVFPGKRTSKDPRSGVERRHHAHETAVQRAVKQAARLAQIP